MQRQSPTNTSLVCSSERPNHEMGILVKAKRHNLHWHCQRENTIREDRPYVG
jgi:hypothetical protein